MRKSSGIATFSARHVAGIHRALINFRGESKALLIGGVIMSFLITHHQWRGTSTSPPSQPPTNPSFALSASYFLVADPSSLLTLTRALSNRVAFHLSFFVRTLRPRHDSFNVRKALVGGGEGIMIVEKGVASENEKKSVRSSRYSSESMQARRERET